MSSNIIVKDPTYGITFKAMTSDDYDSYVELCKRNEAEVGICPKGTEVLLMFYYGKLIGAFAYLGNGQLAHLLVDRDFRGRGFGTILGAVATYMTPNAWTQYRDREVYAKLYAELGYRPKELVDMEKGK